MCVCVRAAMAVQAEEALKQAVYNKALPSKKPELGPAQRVLELLHAPFSDRKVCMRDLPR